MEPSLLPVHVEKVAEESRTRGGAGFAKDRRLHPAFGPVLTFLTPAARCFKAPREAENSRLKNAGRRVQVCAAPFPANRPISHGGSIKATRARGAINFGFFVWYCGATFKGERPPPVTAI